MIDFFNYKLVKSSNSNNLILKMDVFSTVKYSLLLGKDNEDGYFEF